MPPKTKPQAQETPCRICPLRGLPVFQPISGADVTVVESLRHGQLAFAAGSEIIHEGEADPPLYTLFSGWAYRYKTLSDGRRQILNFLLPGDFIGLQQRMSDDASHGVRALSDVQACMFRRDAVWTLHREAPTLGYDVTWLAAHEESVVDENLLSVGRRSAEQRIATLLVLLYKRAAALMPSPDPAGVPFPLTQQHIADALGLSLVHTNKTLRRLERQGLHHIAEGRLQLGDVTQLRRLADLYGDGRPAPRPLI